MRISDVLLFGNLTIDRNICQNRTYTGPGGSVFFLAKIFANLGWTSTIASSYGKDFPKNLLSSSTFIPAKPNSKKTLVFRNVTDKSGLRKQKVENVKENFSLPFEKIPADLRINKAIIYAPIIDNISYQHLEKVIHLSQNCLKVLLPQGYFRRIDKTGKIKKQKFFKAEKIIPLFDLVVASDKDGMAMDSLGRKWSRHGPIVVITKEDRGCSIYNRGKRKDFPAFVCTRIVDSTGAGDVWAGAYTYAYLKLKDIAKSACFANAAACMSLRFTSNKLQYSLEQILNSAKSQNIKIIL